jgi:hypothetical protein
MNGYTVVLSMGTVAGPGVGAQWLGWRRVYVAIPFAWTYSKTEVATHYGYEDVRKLKPADAMMCFARAEQPQSPGRADAPVG